MSAAPFVLRPYQLEAIERVRELVRQGCRRVLLQLETGGGKTACACGLIKMTVDKGNKALFLAGARELVRQASDKLWEFGVYNGVIMAGHGLTPAPVQVASKDTLVARGVKNRRIELPEAQLVIIDECRLSLAGGWVSLLRQYPKAVVLGLDATPCRTDGRGLGDFYQALVQVVKRSELIAGGFITPTEVYAPYVPNLKPRKGEKAYKSDGDYRSDFLARRMDKPTLVGDIVRWWKKLGRDRPTVFFGSSVSHSMHVCDEFNRADITALHVDAESDDAFREDLFGTRGHNGLIADGKVKVVCNFGVVVAGVDQPALGCTIMGRPTKSYTVYKQAIGRAVRPYPGPLYVKEKSILLDHSGCVYLHGLPDDDVEWELSESVRIQDKVKEAADGKPPSEATVTCPKCHALFRGTNRCPACGTVVERQRRPEPVAKKDGVLVKVAEGDLPALPPERLQLLRKLWHKSLAISYARDLTPQSAAVVFKREAGVFPWQVQGLPNLPPQGDQWRRKVRDLYPQYGGQRRTTQ